MASEFDFSDEELRKNYQYKMARNHINAFEKVCSKDFLSHYSLVRSRSMASIERLLDFRKAREYIENAKIPGCVIEIGVWKGGTLGLSMLSSSVNRLHIGIDTFEGHNPPPIDEHDVWGNNMQERWSWETDNGHLQWAGADINETAAFLHGLNARSEFRLLKADITDFKINDFEADSIAILRIDCDWYLETIRSLELFWPRLSIGGVLIIDDYGHHSGSKKAVDEYFKDIPIRFSHVDYSCIVAIRS